MSPEKWQQIKNIIADALSLTPDERPEFLAAACGTDAELRGEVESFLEYEKREGSFLEDPALDFELLKTAENEFAGFTGQQIGNYRIIREIGSGGMGVVFLAERTEGDFFQRVAVKILKRGINSRETIRRFEQERQILAGLEHPFIARLIDGGQTVENVPYFVMEYIEGLTITKYAAAHDLNLEERLSLFRKVCRAVEYAHRHLVVHRDLKPSNILITEDGTPKLLDFGIAKLHKPEAAPETNTGQFVFTPEYASPEQLRAEKLSTATDIYSLGVVLYELLTGVRPFQKNEKNIGELLNVVATSEPPRPSSQEFGEAATVADETRKKTGDREDEPSSSGNPKNLRGDLDNIILKSLRKEPERRYSTVQEFSEDIRRHQAGLPVTASRDTWSYRAQKFIRRNRLSTAVAGLFLLTLVGGFSTTYYQFTVARRERVKAEQRFNDVRRLANSFLFEFHDSIETLPGSTPSRELIVKRALEYLDSLSQEAAGDAGLQRELATAYEKIGQIQGNAYYSNLGDGDGALKSYRRSLEMREILAAKEPGSRPLQNELANSYWGIGDVLYNNADLPGGLENYQKTAAILESLVTAEPANLEYKYLLAGINMRLGDIKGMEGFPNLGDTLGAIENYRRAVSIGEEITAAAPENLSYKSSLATWQTNLGAMRSTTGDPKNAITDLRKAIDTFGSIIAAEPNNTQRRLNMLVTYTFLRYSLIDEMRFEEAIENSKFTIKSLEEMLAADPKNAYVRRGLGVSYNALGRTLLELGEIKAAVENHQKALVISESLAAADVSSGQYRSDVASTLEYLATAQLKAGDYNAALVNYRKALSLSEKSSDNQASLHSGIGQALTAMGKSSEAAESFRQALPYALESWQKSPSNVRNQSRLAAFYLEGGKALKRHAQISRSEKDYSEACEFLRKSFEIWDAQKQKNTLSKLNARYPNEVTKDLAACKQ